MADRNPPDNTCSGTCRAICCRYIVKRISPPRVRLDWDELYWFLCHEKVVVYVEGRKWYLLVNVPCVHLTRAWRCRVYPERPDVCRMHDPRNCEHTGELDFQEYLEKPEDLIRLMQKRGISYRLPWFARGNRAKSAGSGRTRCGRGGQSVGQMTPGPDTQRRQA